MTKEIKKFIKDSQPGNVLNFKAQPGKGQELFDLTNKLHYMKTTDDPTTVDPDGPTDWIMVQPEDDHDTLWALEFYKNQEAHDRHFGDQEIDANHDDIISVLAGMPMRKDVHQVYANTQRGSFAAITPSQPGMMLKFIAKQGKGDELFALTNKLHYMKSENKPNEVDPDGPTDWILCRQDDDPDVMWAIEFYKDEAAYARHFADGEIDDNHDHIIELMGGQPMGVKVHTVYSDDNASKRDQLK